MAKFKPGQNIISYLDGFARNLTIVEIVVEDNRYSTRYGQELYITEDGIGVYRDSVTFIDSAFQDCDVMDAVHDTLDMYSLNGTVADNSGNFSIPLDYALLQELAKAGYTITKNED